VNTFAQDSATHRYAQKQYNISLPNTLLYPARSYNNLVIRQQKYIAKATVLRSTPSSDCHQEDHPNP